MKKTINFVIEVMKTGNSILRNMNETRRYDVSYKKAVCYIKDMFDIRWDERLTKDNCDHDKVVQWLLDDRSHGDDVIAEATDQVIELAEIKNEPSWREQQIDKIVEAMKQPFRHYEEGYWTGKDDEIETFVRNNYRVASLTGPKDPNYWSHILRLMFATIEHLQGAASQTKAQHSFDTGVINEYVELLGGVDITDGGQAMFEHMDELQATKIVRDSMPQVVKDVIDGKYDKEVNNA